MDTIKRFSSRRQRLDHAFLRDRLQGAKSYKRIAGYFRSSIFELVGEEIAHIPDVKIICNSHLDIQDIKISQHARNVAIKEQWNGDIDCEVESLLYRKSYQYLYELLTNGNIEIRVVPQNATFLHGKAGVIEGADGDKTSFLGSANETKRGFAHNYEILWEDPSPEGVAWVEAEFDALWPCAYALPDAIIEEVKRIGDCHEIRFPDVLPQDLPAAALAESPIYRGGEQLQPWQRAFVTLFVQHRDTYGQVRLLLADEVGVGKTLSLAASAMTSALLDDGPVLILCPATLTLQWQVELLDKLGIPSAVWLSNKKHWIDANGHIIKTRGPEDIAACPFQIAIVSTGLITQHSQERDHLLNCRFGTIVLDEAHKARSQGGRGNKRNANRLLAFMRQAAQQTKNILLGTATPIQTDVHELEDLFSILSSGVEFVMGRDTISQWTNFDQTLRLIKGEITISDTREAWEWLRSPFPPTDEHTLFMELRSYLELPDRKFFTSRGFGTLEYLEQEAIATEVANTDFFTHHNPILRHTVLRRRQTLEAKGLLDKIAVTIHPHSDASNDTYPNVNFEGLGLLTNWTFESAYEAAEAFTAALKKRTNKPAGLLKSLLLRRICSSFAAGRLTAEKMLEKNAPDDDEQLLELGGTLSDLTDEESNHLQSIVDALSRPEARDPKLDAVRSFLTKHRTEGKTWLEHGCIIFSQYFDTVYFLASELAQQLPEEPIGVYAGVGKSGLFLGQAFSSSQRDTLKKKVKDRKIRLIITTDAACEGLNLQTLGTLINVDLPWNPSRLEQRLGRIKRFRQARNTVDMLNLVYHDTQDEKVYEALSRRMKDRYDIFGGLPDTIEDDWIENIEQLERQMDDYIHLRQKTRDVFELRYEETVEPDHDRWELCSRVLSRKDVIEKLSQPW